MPDPEITVSITDPDALPHKGIIQGLTLSILGAELIEMAQAQVTDAVDRIQIAEVAKERVEQMPEEDRKIANMKTRDGDMAKDLAKTIESLKKRIEFFGFASEHLEPKALYRLSANELKMFGFEPPRAY